MPQDTLAREATLAAAKTTLLSADGEAAAAEADPACFADLNLDQLVDTLTAGRQDYDLAGWYRAPLTHPEEVRHRHEVVSDLLQASTREAVDAFADRMRRVRRLLRGSKALHYAVQTHEIFLRAAVEYTSAVATVASELGRQDIHSRGMSEAVARLDAYTRSKPFTELASQAQALRASLDAITYRLQVRYHDVTVSDPVDEPDLAAHIVETFRRFSRGATKTHVGALRSYPDMNHVEAAIAARVARLHPEVFATLARFHEQHQPHLIDPGVAAFDREVQFYVAYLELASRLEAAGLPMSLPDIAPSDGMTVTGLYDVVLATQLLDQDPTVVVNDLELTPVERVVVVTGPNQGGKTTFARALGQLAYLTSLGLPVPASHARLPLADHVHTHFPRSENVNDLVGALQDDLTRMHRMLDGAGERTIFVINEMFTSTSSDDALELSRRVLRQIRALGSLVLVVTFLEELATDDPTTVSLVAQVDPHHAGRCTFTLRRQPPDGRAHAEAVARAHGLDASSLRRRLS